MGVWVGNNNVCPKATTSSNGTVGRFVRGSPSLLDSSKQTKYFVTYRKF